MLHSQADVALDAFCMQIAEQSQTQVSVMVIAPCHKFWLAEEYQQELIGLTRQKWCRDTGYLKGLSAFCFACTPQI